MCDHRVLQLDVSQFAELAGFERPNAKTRLAAASYPARTSKAPTLSEQRRESQAFPAPLLLPHDALNYEPDYPPQTVTDCINEPFRKRVTANRKTHYIAAAPEISADVAFMRDWIRPQPVTTTDERPAKRVKTSSNMSLDQPRASDCISYMAAFYHGMPVKPLKLNFRFVPWEDGPTKNRKAGTANGKGAAPTAVPRYVALSSGSHATRIRVRSVPDSPFKAQLNLNDILDHVLSIIPTDAFAVCLMIDHDMYEDDNDDFCAGRAYGGSRVCVVQTARYHPALDDDEKIERDHMWPASHCKDFVDEKCAIEDVKPRKVIKIQKTLSESGPMRAALDAAIGCRDRSSSGLIEADLESLWFSRVARTMAHELGHCMGIDHCVYYACTMQGTASMAEDMRQPPYLCPVCLAKVTHEVATELGGGDEEARKEYVKDRYRSLAAFCRKWKTVEMFAGYGAWAEARLEELGD